MQSFWNFRSHKLVGNYQTQNYGLLIAEQLHRLSMLESESWQAWERSQAAKEQSLSEKMAEAASGGDAKTKIQRRTETRIGDPKFLETLLKCHQERSKLLDLYPASNSDQSVAAEQNLKTYLANLETSDSNGNQHQPVR